MLFFQVASSRWFHEMPFEPECRFECIQGRPFSVPRFPYRNESDTPEPGRLANYMNTPDLPENILALRKLNIILDRKRDLPAIIFNIEKKK
jgi:hypothetical protein